MCVVKHPHHQATIGVSRCLKEIEGHTERYVLYRVDVRYKSACFGRGAAYEVDLPPKVFPVGAKLEVVEAEAMDWLIARTPILQFAKARGEKLPAIQKYQLPCMSCISIDRDAPQPA
jgi:hypothetical protein